jgi:Domain of unknown function (DUF4126)
VANTSPEPFSNIALSTIEDVATGGLLYLAYTHPVAAGIVAAVLLVLTIGLMVMAWRVLRRIFLRVQPEPVPPPPAES